MQILNISQKIYAKIPHDIGENVMAGDGYKVIDLRKSIA